MMVTYSSQTSPGGRNAVTIIPSDALIVACGGIHGDIMLADFEYS